MEKFTPKDDFRRLGRQISKIVQRCYDADQQMFTKENQIRSSVCHEYIPAQYMQDEKPFIINHSIKFDGGKQQREDVDRGALCMTYDQLKRTFTQNEFL